MSSTFALPRVAIIGGGLAGACAAWALARRGAEVTIFERSSIASGASGAAVGALQPLPGMRLSLREQNLRGFYRTQSLLRELLIEGRTWRQPGVLRLVFKEDQAKLWSERFRALPAGLATWLEGSQLRALEPRLQDSVLAGVFMEDACMVDIPAFVEALLAVSDAKVFQNTAVEAVERVADGLELRLSKGHRATYDKVIVASGAQAPQPLRDPDISMAPYMGIIAAFAGLDPPAVALNHRGYIAAWRDNSVVVGTVDRRPPFDDEPSAASVEELGQRLHCVLNLPKLPRLMRVWKGVRPAMPDREPVARMSTQMEDVWYFTGFGGRGLLLGPALAEDLATAMLGAPRTTSVGIA